MIETMTRRDFARLALAAGVAAPANARPESRFGGVRLGVQFYSFRDRALDAALQAAAEIGFTSGEMNYRHIEPAALARKRGELREWRLKEPLAEYEQMGKKARAAGIEPWCYTYNMRADFTEAEMAKGFEATKAMGARAICCSPTLDVVPKIDALARQYRIHVAMHNHSNIAPGQLATPDDFAAVRKGASDYIGFALDIGHFTAAGFDPVAFLREHHQQILLVHVKDRKRAQGPNVPLGQGDTPVKEVLRMIRDNRWDIRADIEYEYESADTMAEVGKCFAYCRDALMG
jgi:sugar phosphate isomerase/epimerase